MSGGAAPAGWDWLRRNRQEAFRCEAAGGKTVDCDAVADIAFVFIRALRIGKRSYAGIDVAAIRAEGEAAEISLMSFLSEACVREVGELVAFEIQNGNGLPEVRFAHAIAGIQNGDVAPVRTAGHGDGQRVSPLRRARQRQQKLLARRQCDRAPARWRR